MTIENEDEDSATEALCLLLKKSDRARKVFLHLVFGPNLPACFVGEMEVEAFHLTDRGQEIDLLLHAGPNAVIVECKVGDTQKVYQLASYRDYWVRKYRHSKPSLVWLVQRPQQLIGADELGATTITWNALRDAMASTTEHTSLCETGQIEAFVRELNRSGISLPSGTPLERRRVYRGYDPNAVCRVLDLIRMSVPEVIGGIEQTNELTPALHVGQKAWAKLLGDSWVQRVWLYYKPDTDARTRVGGFYFHGQIVLHHRHKAGNFQPKVAARIATRLRRLGLAEWRNKPGKWKYREHADDPMAIGSGLNYYYVEETEAAARARGVHSWEREQDAVFHGAAHLRELVQWTSEALQHLNSKHGES